MAENPTLKFIPRNVAALRRGQKASDAARLVAGNSSATRLESGVGNCFPGLELDIRNLERRFFPFLEVDMIGNRMDVIEVDMRGVRAARRANQLSKEQVRSYRTVAQGIGKGVAWRVRDMSGTFGPLGPLKLRLSRLTQESIGEGRKPSDAWTAVRMLSEAAVTLTLVTRPRGARVDLNGKRSRYFDENGALARMFEPGELTQSLCSPWTHDFRDCGCYYWASNHPDIALPPLPASEPTALEPKWYRNTPWQRSNRDVQKPPVATRASAERLEMRYHEINRDWQRLHFVLERRERLTPYVSEEFPHGEPLADYAELIAHLQYAAGVELAVMQEYLTAAYSLLPEASAAYSLLPEASAAYSPEASAAYSPEAFAAYSLPPEAFAEYSLQSATFARPAMLRDDLRVAFAELIRAAQGEMMHLAHVNAVLRQVMTPATFEPALAVACCVPTGVPRKFRPVQFRPATAEVLEDFIAIEAPSVAVDGLYARILATLKLREDPLELQEHIRIVMAEGEDHWRTFKLMREYLCRHPEFLLRAAALVVPPPDNPAHAELQRRYAALLDTLYKGYQLEGPDRAAKISEAMTAMHGDDGIQGALQAVANEGYLVAFDPLADARFHPIWPPA